MEEEVFYFMVFREREGVIENGLFNKVLYFIYYRFLIMLLIYEFINGLCTGEVRVLGYVYLKVYYLRSKFVIYEFLRGILCI